MGCTTTTWTKDWLNGARCLGWPMAQVGQLDRQWVSHSLSVHATAKAYHWLRSAACCRGSTSARFARHCQLSGGLALPPLVSSGMVCTSSHHSNDIAAHSHRLDDGGGSLSRDLKLCIWYRPVCLDLLTSIELPTKLQSEDEAGCVASVGWAASSGRCCSYVFVVLSAQ